MKTYHARFQGRTVGAIGIVYMISADVTGDTPEAARLRLYDRFEHIQALRLVEVHNPNCDGDQCAADSGEVRVLPECGEGNSILCRSCFDHSIAYRRDRNQGLDASCRFDLPAWESLKVYGDE